MSGLWKWILGFFFNPKKRNRKLIAELVDFSDSLQKIKLDDPLEDIVRFFSLVSVWFDRIEETRKMLADFTKVNRGQYDEVINEIINLRSVLIAVGRRPDGANRTKAGEGVTEKEVYLGGIFGLFTHPVSYWKTAVDGERGGWGIADMEKMNSYDVVCRQAVRFVFPYKKMIVEAVAKIAAS